MKVAVCDPCGECLEAAEKHLKEISLVASIELFSEVNYLFDEMKNGVYYDVVMIEIDWDRKKAGIEFAKKLQKLGPYTKIIYMNESAEEYIEEIFLNTSNLSGFVLKPIEREFLKRNLEKIWNQKMNTDEKLIVRTKGNVLAIPYDEILCIESQLHRTKIVLKDEMYQCSEKLDRIVERLNEQFYRCHQSYIVNMKQVRVFCRTEIVLSNGKVIPVSKTRYKDAREYLMNFLKG